MAPLKAQPPETSLNPGYPRAIKGLGLTLSLSAMLILGCSGEDPTNSPSPTPTAVQGPTPTPTATPTPTPTAQPACSDDLDGDGFVSDQCLGGTDCNDVDASVYPNAPEGIDGDLDGVLEGDFKDNDCDEIIDEGTNAYDDDGDGFSEIEGDCNDRAPGISPGVAEACDGIDNDCDGISDNKDTDKDGYFSAACGGDDCNDFNPEQYPGAPEGTDGGDGTLISDGVDNDCDEIVDEDTNTSDDDGDGISEAQGDCDDRDPLVYAGATERFDDKDQNCDGDLRWQPTADAAPASAIGSLAGSQAGHSIDGTGDVNGDGFGDLIIGAPYYDPEGRRSGAAFLLPGRQLGWNENMDLAEGPMFTPQDSPGALAGWAVAGTGDMNRDGIPDFAIGAPGLTYAANAAAGGIFVYPGQGVPWEDQVLGQQGAFGGSSSYGVYADVEFGFSLAGGGGGRGCDVNGDDVADLLIGGPWDVSALPSNARGYLMFLPGGGLPPQAGISDLVSFSGAGDQAIGYSVACGGDFNGVPESTGAYPAEMFVAGKGDGSNAGSVSAVVGSIDYQSPGPKGPVPQGSATWNGGNGSQWLGRPMSPLGDTNGDGLDDIAIGMLNRTADQPLAYVLYGSAAPEGGSLDTGSSLLITGGEDELCPCSVSGVGDFNGDGFEDLVVSAANSPSDDGASARAGRIFLFLGKAGGFGAPGTLLASSDADFTFSGLGAGDEFGRVLARAGDLNADGFADFAVGAPLMSGELEGEVAEEVGKVFIFFGFDTSNLP